MASMTPRERVLCTVHHEKPDRVPRDFWAEKPTLRRLFGHIGDDDEERLLSRLGIDLRHLNAVEPPERAVGPGMFQNFWGERYIYRPTPWGPMREDTRGALAEARSLDEMAAFPFPSPDSMDHSQVHEAVKRWEPYALVYGFADVWERPALVRGWENWFIDMVERPDWVHFLCRTFTDFYLEEYTRAARAARGRIDIFLLLTDLGSQRGPLISLEMFHEFVAPYLSAMIQRIHDLGALVMFHSCGDARAFIPELIRLGIDILDPIQPVNCAMSPERLKEDFGQRLCFHGGLDMQGLLPSASPEAVRGEARRYETVFRDGGYILAPAHLFQPDVPPQNVLAMYGA